MRKGLKKFVQVALSVVLVLLLLALILWKTVPRWLPALAQHWLPAGTQLSLSDSPRWSDGVLSLPGLRYNAGNCVLAQAKNARLGQGTGRWVLVVDALTVDTACLSHLPASAES